MGQFAWVVPGAGSDGHNTPSPLSKVSKHAVLKQANGFLAGAGWHCSWCLRTAADVAWKAANYNHWDRKQSVGAWSSISAEALEARIDKVDRDITAHMKRVEENPWSSLDKKYRDVNIFG